MPPIQLLLTRRLLLAKQLLTETALPITEVAFASGFSSLRRFNDAFNRRYGMPPTRLRKKATEGAGAIIERQTSTLQLSYRPPYDWKGGPGLSGSSRAQRRRARHGSSYARTVQLGKAKGWIRVTQSGKKHALMVEFTHSLTPVLPSLLSRIRALFDLDARPDVIAKHLSKDARLAAAVKANPGMRVPGAFNGFEMGLRAILGQQVTVKAATTIACRFVEAFGEPIVTPFAELNRLTPAAGAHRFGQRRRNCPPWHRRIAMQEHHCLGASAEIGELCLDGGAHHNPDDSIKRLAELPGIGQWTAHYIAMRALRWPDAFPKEDIAVRNKLGGVTAKEAEALSQSWRPWRSYAVMHVWGMPASAACT